MELTLSLIIVITVALIILLELFFIIKVDVNKSKFRDFESILLWILSIESDSSDRSVRKIPKVDSLIKTYLGDEFQITDIIFDRKAKHNITSFKLIRESDEIFLRLLLNFPKITVNTKPTGTSFIIDNLETQMDIRINQNNVSVPNKIVYDAKITSSAPLNCRCVNLNYQGKPRSEKKAIEKKLKNLISEITFKYSYQINLGNIEEAPSERLKPFSVRPSNIQEVVTKTPINDKITEEIISKANVQSAFSTALPSRPNSVLCPQNQNILPNTKGHVNSEFVIEPIQRSTFKLSEEPLKSETSCCKPLGKKKVKTPKTKTSNSDEGFAVDDKKTNKLTSSGLNENLDIMPCVLRSSTPTNSVGALNNGDLGHTFSEPVVVKKVKEPVKFVVEGKFNQPPCNTINVDLKTTTSFPVQNQSGKPRIPKPTRKREEERKIEEELEKDLAEKVKAPIASFNDEFDYTSEKFVNSFPVKSFIEKTKGNQINFMNDPLDQTAWRHSIIDDKIEMSLLKRMDEYLPDKKKASQHLKVDSDAQQAETAQQVIYETSPEYQAEQQAAYMPPSGMAKPNGKKNSFLTKTIPCLFEEKNPKKKFFNGAWFNRGGNLNKINQSCIRRRKCHLCPVLSP